MDAPFDLGNAFGIFQQFANGDVEPIQVKAGGSIEDATISEVVTGGREVTSKQLSHKGLFEFAQHQSSVGTGGFPRASPAETPSRLCSLPGKGHLFGIG